MIAEYSGSSFSDGKDTFEALVSSGTSPHGLFAQMERPSGRQSLARVFCGQ